MNNIEYIRNNKKQLSFLLNIWLTGFVLSNLWIAVVSTKKCMNEAPPAFYGRWQDPPHDGTFWCVIANILLIIPCTGFKAALTLIAIPIMLFGLAVTLLPPFVLMPLGVFVTGLEGCLMQIPCMCGEEAPSTCMHV